MVLVSCLNVFFPACLTKRPVENLGSLFSREGPCIFGLLSIGNHKDALADAESLWVFGSVCCTFFAGIHVKNSSLNPPFLLVAKSNRLGSRQKGDRTKPPKDSSIIFFVMRKWLIWGSILPVGYTLGELSF